MGFQGKSLGLGVQGLGFKGSGRNNLRVFQGSRAWVFKLIVGEI